MRREDEREVNSTAFDPKVSLSGGWCVGRDTIQYTTVVVPSRAKAKHTACSVSALLVVVSHGGDKFRCTEPHFYVRVT